MDRKRTPLADIALGSGAGAVEPPPSLRERVLATARGDGFQTMLAEQGTWRPSPRTRGVMLKTLYRPSEQAPGTVLLRSPAATSISELDEARNAALFVVDGELQNAGDIYGASDFLAWSTGALTAWRSPTGCTVLVVERGTAGEASATPPVVRGHEGTWRELGGGARIKPLTGGAGKVSMALLTMSPGGTVPEHEHDGVEEVFLLQGECTSDAQPLRAGDYQRGLPGSVHRTTTTGTGCTMVVVLRPDRREA